MNHLIFSAVLTACLGIGGHQHSHQHGLTTNRPMSTSTRSQRSSTPPRCTPGPCWCCPAPPSTWMMTVYPILTALTGFQVSNLVPYLARILPHFMGLYTVLKQNQVIFENANDF
ncbi:hypothetical protein DSO57_1026856 [Entomophthora muscae]|uniref:Uncharacterized protein n=1 Tax=Entomophthora muscae TaxID=34485 RepID=A0ACC2SET2_9FUNG|nr:hypothetical protein DSO57_1026856 [Entomophthora muscae]